MQASCAVRNTAPRGGGGGGGARLREARPHRGLALQAAAHERHERRRRAHARRQRRPQRRALGRRQRLRPAHLAVQPLAVRNAVQQRAERVHRGRLGARTGRRLSAGRHGLPRCTWPAERSPRRSPAPRKFCSPQRPRVPQAETRRGSQDSQRQPASVHDAHRSQQPRPQPPLTRHHGTRSLSRDNSGLTGYHRRCGRGSHCRSVARAHLGDLVAQQRLGRQVRDGAVHADLRARGEVVAQVADAWSGHTDTPSLRSTHAPFSSTSSAAVSIMCA
jgi:hypothetical protein